MEKVNRKSPVDLWKQLKNNLTTIKIINEGKSIASSDPFQPLDVAVMSANFYATSSDNDYSRQRHGEDASSRNTVPTSLTPNYNQNSLNSLHLRTPYRTLGPLEGFALRENYLKLQSSFSNKGATMYRSKDSSLRSRYNKNILIKRDSFPGKHHDRDEDKEINLKKTKLQMCLKDSEFGQGIKQYCTNSTLHGLRYVGDSDLSLLERLFWIVSFGVALSTAIYYIWFLYQKWTSSPIIISLSPEPVSLNEIPFPSVTVCNMNNAKKSEATRIIRGSNKYEKLLLDDICNTDNNSIFLNVNEEQAPDWNTMLRFMINVSQSCTDMLYTCQWHGIHTDCEKIFNPTMTDEGICCNFNSVNREYMFYNPQDWSDLNVTFPFPGIDWTPETGYNSSVPPDYIPWRPYGAGQYYGLSLVLDAETDDYYCSSTASVGFKMLLHNPIETPKIADFAFLITPGEETRIIVTPRISTASRSILSIPQRKRKCFFTSERKLRYYRTYTQRNCILECEANFTQEICHCVPHYMPKSSNTPICGKKDDLCAITARRTMEMKLYDEDKTINQLNITEIPSCNCWPGCFEINYNIGISQSKLLTKFHIAERYIKKSPKYFIENMAVVHLFFVNSQFTKFAKNELYGFTEFLSSTGGLLGLCMGFSFLSLMEIVYFLTLRLLCRFQKNKNSRRTVLQVHPIDSNRSVIYPFAQ